MLKKFQAWLCAEDSNNPDLFVGSFDRQEDAHQANEDTMKKLSLRKEDYYPLVLIK